MKDTYIIRTCLLAISAKESEGCLPLVFTHATHFVLQFVCLCSPATTGQEVDCYAIYNPIHHQGGGHHHFIRAATGVIMPGSADKITMILKWCFGILSVVCGYLCFLFLQALNTRGVYRSHGSLEEERKAAK